jgi:hypothetical protein
MPTKVGPRLLEPLLAAAAATGIELIDTSAAGADAALAASSALCGMRR